MSYALIEDLEGNHGAVPDCLDPGGMAAGFVLTPQPEAAAEGPLRVDVWLCYFHDQIVQSGLAGMRFEPPQAA